MSPHRKPAGYASTDEEVVRRYQRALRAAGGPPASLMVAMNEVFAGLWDPIFGLCRRFVRDDDRARDLTQQTLLRALDKIEQYRGETRFLSWVYSIARSQCASALRRSSELLVDDGVIDARSEEASALQRLDERQRSALLAAAAAASLSPVEQEAVYLRYVERLPQDAITAVLAVDQASGARGVLQAARRKLNREIRRRLAEMGRGSSWVKDTL